MLYVYNSFTSLHLYLAVQFCSPNSRNFEELLEGEKRHATKTAPSLKFQSNEKTHKEDDEGICLRDFSWTETTAIL